jgi:hypothetical protein
MLRITCAVLAAALLAAGCATREGRAAAQMETCAAAAGAADPANHVAADGSIEARFRLVDTP